MDGLFLVDRRRVLNHIRNYAARIVVLLAPPGYGKTYLARRLAQEDAIYETLDGAIAEASADGVYARIGRIAEAVRTAGGGRGTLVLERAERMLEVSELARVFEDLPPEVRVVLCARSDHALAATRPLAPHTVDVLRRELLAFDEDEMRQLFSCERFDDAEFRRIQRFTRGWPAVALYVERAWDDIAAQNALAQPALAPALTGLIDYVAAEVLAPLDPAALRELAAAAALGERGDSAQLRVLVRGLQLARVFAGGVVDIHPPTRAALMRDYAALLDEILEREAGEAEKLGEQARAARLYVQAGRADEASRILKTLSRKTITAPLPIYPELYDRFRTFPHVLYPETWVALARTRRLLERPERLAQEGSSIVEHLALSEDDSLFNSAVATTATALLDCGNLDEAVAMVERARVPQDAGVKGLSYYQTINVRAAIEAHRGRFGAALAHAVRERDHAAPYPTWYVQAMAIDARVARARGEWELEYEILERMFSQAKIEPSAGLLGRVFGEGIFGAWLAGDDQTFDAYRAQLHETLIRYDVPALENLDLAAQGHQPMRKRGFTPLFDAWAFIIAATQARGRELAAASARSAIAFADRSADLFTRIVARVVLAEKAPSQRRKALGEAAALSVEIESEKLRESVAALAQGEVQGMLAPLIGRLRSTSNTFEATEAPVSIYLANGVVRRGDNELQISVGGMALLVALAVEGRPLSTDTLCDRLWPDADYEQAYKALKMCVSRTRAQIGDPKAILTADGAYVLGEKVAADVSFLPQLLHSLRRGSVPGKIELDETFEVLVRGRPASFSRWEWFAPTEALFERATREIGLFLGRESLRHRDIGRALEFARRLISIDSLDEEARRLAVEAYMAAGDRSAALYEYRQYQQVLDRELGTEPSAELRALLEF
ncbi:MAG: AfsR/SARP family transcriptional regulator [Vulcanimicrobiaceae bacterium]